MRTVVEFLDLYCTKTKEPGEDEVNLKFNRATLWAGPMRSGITKKIETIKVLPAHSVIIELWEDDSARRTINKLGTQTISRPESDYSGNLSAHFATEGAEYTLSYRFLQIPD